MNAWVVRKWGPPEEMTYEEWNQEPLADDHVRIRIDATGINFFEGLLVEGKYQVRPELPFIPGVEGAGVVVEPGSAPGVRAGQRVAFLADYGRGTYAELADVKPSAIVPIPDVMASDEGASFLTTYLTAHFGLHRRAHLRRRETLLVHAGAGGVGSAAIHLGKAAGARVIATAGTDEKVAFCVAQGAEFALNYRQADFVSAVKEFTGGRGADVVFDPVGGDVFERSTKCIAMDGRIVVVGFTSGRIPQIATNHPLLKSYSIVGVHLNLYLQRIPDQVASVAGELLELYRDGAIKPQIGARYPLTQAPSALRAVMSGQSLGKTVLVASGAQI